MIKSYKNFILLILLSSLTAQLKAQLEFGNDWYYGQSNAASEASIKTALTGKHQQAGMHYQAFLQTNLAPKNTSPLAGICISAQKDSISKAYPFNLLAQYLYSPFSQTLNEHNWTFIGSKESKGFTFDLGLNFKLYRYSKYANDNYDLLERSYHEFFALVYNIGYTYPIHNKWRISLWATNYDDFFINQTNNPFLRLKSQFVVTRQLSFFIDGNYIKSGMLNGSSNYYGYYLKTGIRWICE